MHNTKINLAKSAGFCFGVKRALDIAFKTSQSSQQVYMLGDIVHNEDVVKEIKNRGIKRIRQLRSGINKTLLVPAHGSPLNLTNKARLLGYKIIDATCPMVKEIHKVAVNMEKKGYKIIIIGDKKHAEVRGIAGQIKTNAIVIDGIKNIPFKRLKRIKKYAIVVQSTQNLEKVTEIVDILKQRIEELKFFNTICMPTRIKQQDIKTLPKENDVMVIIGSKASANTRRLYEISRALNQKSYWIQSSKEINPVWFKGAASIGVTAGASTPDSITNDVIEYIKQSV